MGPCESPAIFIFRVVSFNRTFFYTIVLFEHSSKYCRSSTGKTKHPKLCHSCFCVQKLEHNIRQIQYDQPVVEPITDFRTSFNDVTSFGIYTAFIGYCSLLSPMSCDFYRGTVCPWAHTRSHGSCDLNQSTLSATAHSLVFWNMQRSVSGQESRLCTTKCRIDLRTFSCTLTKGDLRLFTRVVSYSASPL